MSSPRALRCFNPRARGGRDLREPCSRALSKCFNPRARGGRDPRLSRQKCKCQKCFNPRARGGRDESVKGISHARLVSIHAPAGGATYLKPLARYRAEVSIHAPAGGATWTAGAMSAYTSCFNPRARGGRDEQGSLRRIIMYKVSIHAPAGGATSYRASRTHQVRAFQSTRPRGARLNPQWPPKPIV